jgi:hypothetical protein
VRQGPVRADDAYALFMFSSKDKDIADTLK